MECRRACTGPLYTRPQRMDDVIEYVRAPTRGALAVAKVLGAVWPHASMALHLPMVCGITPGITGARRTCQHPIRPGGHALQRVQAIRQQHHLRGLHWSPWKGRQHRALVVGDGHNLLSLPMCVADVPQGDATSLMKDAGIF